MKVRYPQALSHTVCAPERYMLSGFREVIGNGAGMYPPAVAVITMSPLEELNAVPVLVTVVCAPLVGSRLTLSCPWVTLQLVEEPALELKVIEVL